MKLLMFFLGDMDSPRLRRPAGAGVSWLPTLLLFIYNVTCLIVIVIGCSQDFAENLMENGFRRSILLGWRHCGIWVTNPSLKYGVN